MSSLWRLGEHRLLCGDSRNPDDVAELFGGQKANVVITSPPYASQRKYDPSSGFKPIRPAEYVDWYRPVASIIAEHLAADGSYFLNIKEHCEDGQRVLYVKDLTLAHVRTWRWRFVDEFCWTKNGVPGIWPNRFKNAWEPIFHFSLQKKVKFYPLAVGHSSKQAFRYRPGIPQTPARLLSSKRNADGLGEADLFVEGIARPGNHLKVQTGEAFVAGRHVATFPVGLPEFFIKAFSDEGDIVYDPFIGSGTTLIAAERLGRVAYGCEISPEYCAVIIERWEQLTGGCAELIEDEEAA